MRPNRVSMWSSGGLEQRSAGQQTKQTRLLGAMGKDPVTGSGKKESRHLEWGSRVKWGKVQTLEPE